MYIRRKMSNPVDVIADAVIETSNDFRFPITIGSRVRGEEKFTFIKVKEILPASISREPKIIGTIVLPMPTNLNDLDKRPEAKNLLGIYSSL